MSNQPTALQLAYLRAELSKLHRSGGTMYEQSPQAAELDRKIKQLEGNNL